MLNNSFAKFQGAGNDFLLIDDRKKVFPLSLVPRLCHRKFGVGADGVLLVQQDSSADFCMRIFNADGTEAESCGNGLRCFMKFLLDLGFEKKQYHIRTGKEVVLAEFVDEQVAIHLKKPSFIQKVSLLGKNVHVLNTGVAHAVIFSEDELLEIGPKMQEDSFFSLKKVNVNVAQIKGDYIVARTFERGVGETLACGTGAAAIGYVACQEGLLKSPVRVCMRGGDLWISLKEESLVLQGDAKKVFEGRWME